MMNQKLHVKHLNTRETESARNLIGLTCERLQIHQPGSPATLLAERAARAVEDLQKEIGA